MANNLIQIKRTSVSGRAANTTTLSNAGELALNMADGILYSTNGSVVFEIGANNTNAQVTGTLTVNAISANGGTGTAGQVLTTNGSNVYWSSASGGGTVTQVNTGVGLTGGPIDTTGTISVNPNTGIVANASGLFVNATYIETLDANNASYLGGLTSSQFLRSDADDTATGVITFSANVISNSTLDANVITVDTLQILGGSGTQGTITWNTDEETIDIVQNGATLQVGQEIYYHVKNQTGNTIPDGTAVMATGTLGVSGRITVAPMVANGSVASRFYLGVATEDIVDGGDGKVTHFGKIRGIDLTAYDEGDVLWLDPSTAGGFTTTEPEAPNLKIDTAFVISNTDPGTMMVRANPGFRISDLHDVEITSATNNQFLVYDNVDGRWENRTANTTIIDEGDNLYYTVARANSAIDARVTQSFVNALGVDANTVNGNTAATLRSYSDTTAATAYSNATGYADTAAGTAYSNATSYADTAASTAYSNAVSTAATDATNKAANAYSNAVSYADTAAGTAYSNATSYADTAASTAYTNATSYADTAAGTAYSNAVSYVGSQSFVNTSQLSSNLSNYALLSGATFTGSVTANDQLIAVNDSNNPLTLNRTTTTGDMIVYEIDGVQKGTVAIDSGDAFTMEADNGSFKLRSIGVTSLEVKSDLVRFWMPLEVRASAGNEFLSVEGITDDTNEVTFAVTDPTADRTITFPDASGTVALLSGATFSGDVTVSANLAISSGLSANGGFGTDGQVLTSNGTVAYWADAAGGGSGGGYYFGDNGTVGDATNANNIFRVNNNSLNANVTFADGQNGSAAGPVTIADGVTLTIQSGARVAIV